jgi:hypothetical protein
MPSILLSDNGVSSGSAGIKQIAASDGALALQTTTGAGAATTAVTVDTSQRVGVGQSTPAYLLDVNGTMRLGSGGTVQPLLLRSTVTGGLVVNTTASGGAGPLVVQDNGTEVLRVTDSLVVLKGGNTAATGTGITFPATQSASSDANTLDDYEEGNWTPTVSAQTGSITSYTSSASYTKIGRVVNIRVYITITNKGTASSRLQVTNAPFVIAGVNSGDQPATITRESNNSGTGYLVYAPAGTTEINIQTLTGNMGITWANGDVYSYTLTYQT